MKTYRNKEDVLRQTFGICRGTSKLGKFANSVYMCKNEMNAKIR